MVETWLVSRLRTPTASTAELFSTLIDFLDQVRRHEQDFLVRARPIQHDRFVARNSSPGRCTIVTRFANFVRKVASSMAVSPPPTTRISRLRKNEPSHVAHVETPCPSSFRSDSSPSICADAPAAITSD